MNIICKIFGHKRILRDFYPTDPISSVACLRCDKVLTSAVNTYFIGYSPNHSLTQMVCVDNSKVDLTKGRVYDILHSRDNDFYIKDDKGVINNFDVRRFTTVVRYRKEKLKYLNNVTL